MLHNNHRTKIYRRDELVRLVNPKSIAIVGASGRVGSFGARAAANLDAFEGDVYLVNARYEEIGGQKCYPALAALPVVPDCVLLMVAQEAVEGLLDECIGLGVGGVIVHASGFAETGKSDNVAKQSRMVSSSRASGTRLFGPNSLGIVNYVNGARMTFGRMPPVRPLGQISLGLVCQSGALGMALSQAVERGVSISHTFMLGNASEVDLADCVSYLAEEAACHAIVCVFEGMENPTRLIAAARVALEYDKPLIVYKMATGESGAAAAMSHTGMLAGSNASYRALLNQAGAVMVDSLDEVIETAQFFAKAGRPRASGAAVIVTSGGAGVMTADKAEEHGVAMPQPLQHTLDVLATVVPEFGAARNPCDITAQVLNDEPSFVTCADAMLSDDSYGTLIIAHMFADDVSTARLQTWNQLSKKHDKIVCNYWASEWLEGPGAVEAEQQPGIAMFRSLDRCMKTLAHWGNREAVFTAPVAISVPVSMAVRQTVRERLFAAQGKFLAEREGKQILELYGVPVVSDRLVRSAEEAVEAADLVGWPVVLKVDSDAIAHKTEAGVLALNLADKRAVLEAYDRLMHNARNVVRPEQINGVLVQPMIPPGLEVLVGGTVDPSFGPVLVVGFGGVLVELLRDTVTLPVPASLHEIRQGLESLKGARLFGGFRGGGPVDLNALSQMIERISQFMDEHRDVVQELDVNPIICVEGRILAADALIVC